MEGKMKTIPLKLVQMADEECQILRHSHQWVKTIDPSVTALQASLEDRSKHSQTSCGSLLHTLDTINQDRDTQTSIFQPGIQLTVAPLTAVVSMTLLPIFTLRNILKGAIGIFVPNVEEMELSQQEVADTVICAAVGLPAQTAAHMSHPQTMKGMPQGVPFIVVHCI
jgi:hypothetical protein